MKNKKHAPAYILIFKTRQFYYDTHTVRAKHTSVGALTPQESCNKVCLTGCVSQGRNDCCLDTIKVTLVHAVFSGSCRQRQKAPSRRKGRM